MGGGCAICKQGVVENTSAQFDFMNEYSQDEYEQANKLNLKCQMQQCQNVEGDIQRVDIRFGTVRSQNSNSKKQKISQKEHKPDIAVHGDNKSHFNYEYINHQKQQNKYKIVKYSQLTNNLGVKEIQQENIKQYRSLLELSETKLI